MTILRSRRLRCAAGLAAALALMLTFAPAPASGTQASCPPHCHACVRWC